jgi:hypothetical protein
MPAVFLANSRRNSIRERGQLDDEGEHLIEILDQLDIGRDQLAAFLLRQRDVETIVDAAAHLRGDVVGTLKLA